MFSEQKPGAEDHGEPSTDIGEQVIKAQCPCHPKLSLLTRLIHPLEVFWLFTESDLFTFVLPNTVFGILGALSGSRLTTDAHVPIGSVLERVPVVVLFNWSNVFVFELANQRHPESVSNHANPFSSFHESNQTHIPI